MIGLTGGIGSGKSVAARRLAELGAVIVDSDRIAREVVAPGTDGLREIVAVFGDRVLDADGALDRPALAAVVFGDDAARARLEAITHPRVRARSAQLVAEAPADAIVVNDVPLLVEVGLAATYHLVIVVEAELSTRAARLVRDRAMTPEQADQRIRAQTSDERRRAAADVVLRNDGELSDLHVAIDLLWRDRLVPYERNLRQRRAVRTDGLPSVPADPTWPAQFARLAARIRHALAPAEPLIEHIGPTAVPGRPAPDVIDVQIAVDGLVDQGDQQTRERVAESLARAGFPRVTDGDQWRHGSADPARPVNLYLRTTTSAAWQQALLSGDQG